MAVTPTNSVINLNVPAVAPDGFDDPQVKGAVEMFLAGFNNLLREMERYGGFTQKDITLWSSLLPSDTLLRHQVGRLYVTASEAIGFGDFVNLHNTAGVLNVRKANGASGAVKKARGFCTTVGGIAIGAKGEVILSQGLLVISGVNPGDDVYLSATPGQATLVALTGAGQLEQYLGTAVATNLVYIDITMGQYIQH